MNSRGIIVLGVIAVISIGVAFLSTTQQFDESMTPSIESNLIITDDTSLSLNYPDKPEISDSQEVEDADVTFFINEEGKKQYSIEVGDTPSIQD